jgi:hypothetical protein
MTYGDTEEKHLPMCVIAPACCSRTTQRCMHTWDCPMFDSNFEPKNTGCDVRRPFHSIPVSTLTAACSTMNAARPPKDEALFLSEASFILRSEMRPGNHILVRDFRAHFGVNARLCQKIWELCDDNFFAKNILPKHLVWGLLFLKTLLQQAPQSHGRRQRLQNKHNDLHKFAVLSRSEFTRSTCTLRQ